MITTYSGSPSWSDLSGALPGSPNAFTPGVSTNTVTLSTPFHTDRFTVTDGAVSSQSRPFNVFGPVSKFDFSFQKPVTHGVPFIVRLYAVDSGGNVVDYSGSTTWSDRSGGLSGSPASFSAGVSTNTVTLPNPYFHDKFTATDGTVSGSTGLFNVG